MKSPVETDTFLEEVRAKGCHVSDGWHNGFFTLEVSGVKLNSRAIRSLRSHISVEGVAWIELEDPSTIEVSMTPHPAGRHRSYDEIKAIQRSFVRALVSWAKGLPRNRITHFIEEGVTRSRPSPNTMVVYGD